MLSVDSVTSKRRYGEINHFNWTTHDTTIRDQSVHHFAQVIWKKATKIGIGVAVHKETKFVYVVARYDTPVFHEQTRENVMPLIH